MKEFFQRAVAIVMVAVYSISVAPASEIALSYQAERRTLDAYLERAQIQTDKERFEKIAQDGLGAAIAEWEQNSLELKFRDYDEWLLQKDALQEELENQKELSFAAWAQKRQEKQNVQIQKTALYNELHQAALEFAYMKANGNTTRIVSKEFIGEAKAQWSAIAQEIVKNHIDQWNSTNDYDALLQNEFLAMETAITNSLVNELLYDHSSLKKLSDDEAACVIAQGLADDVEEQTSASMTALFNSMQTELQGVDQDVANGTKEKEWLEKFEKELQAGLAKWDEAERSFLASRVEWEQNAENIFLNDNQKWQEAYNELERRKSQWAEKIEKQIQDGKAQWQIKFASLENEINEYFEEFQYKLALELQQKEQLVQAEISNYNKSREILVMAQTGIENWYSRWGEKYRGLYSYWKTESDFGTITNLNIISIENLKNELYQWKKDFIKIAKNLSSKASKNFKVVLDQPLTSQPSQELQNLWTSKNNELRLFSKEISKYSENSSFAEVAEMCKKISEKKSLMKTFCTEFYKSVDDSIWDFFDYDGTYGKACQELFSWLDMYEKYLAETENSITTLYSLTGGAIENSNQNEIDKEIAKLKALESYWQSRQAVAQTTYEYAENSSSSAETADKTKENLETTLKEYEDLKKEYQNSLGTLYTLQEQVSKAQENYFNASAAADEALLKLEEERKIYDELYEQWIILNNDKSFETLLFLNSELDALDLNDSDFEVLLLEYAEYLQKKEKAELAEKIRTVKNLFEYGNKKNPSVNFQGIEDSEIDNSEFIEEEKQVERIFSTLELNSLSAKIERILSSTSLNYHSIEAILDDLETFDKDIFSELESELESQDQEKDNNIRQSLFLYIAKCKKELKQREAILLLCSGSTEEIDNYFYNNPDMSDIYENYKTFSFALLRQSQQAALSKIADIMQNPQYKNMEEYIKALESAAVGLGSTAKTLLGMYKKTILDEENSQKAQLESTLMAKINQNFADKNLIIKEQDFHTMVYENLFSKEIFNYDFDCAEEYKATENELYALLDTTQARNEILLRMQEEYELSLKPQQMLAELNKQMEKQQQTISQAENDFNKKTDALKGESDTSALNSYVFACDTYNSALQESHKLYDQLENARREYRIAEEIYFYAENEYLHGNTDLQTPLEIATQKLSETRAAIEVLLEIKNEKSTGKDYFEFCKEFKDYKESTKQYYKARILAYEYEQEIKAQKERLYQAQLAEQAALKNLVCEFKDNISGTEFQIPAIIADFIHAEKIFNDDGTFTYSFELNSIEEINSIQEQDKSRSQDVLTEYYTSSCISIKDIYGNETFMTIAKNDALDFLNSMEEKDYSLEDLALALLYIKMQGDDEQKSRWLEKDENPEISANYPTGDIPEKMHSVDIWAAYNEGRQKALLNAYNKVMNNGGKEDLVKYILFSQTNIRSSLKLYQRQHDALSIRGFDNVISKINSKTKTLRNEANIYLSVASAYSIILCLPFGLGSWAAGLFAAAMTVYISLTGAANKLDEVKTDVQEMQRGYQEYSEIYQKAQESYMESWHNSVETRKAEETRFNILLYGQEEKTQQTITWNDFDNSLKELLKKNQSTADYDYFSDLHNIEFSGKTLRDFFDEITEKENFSNVNDIAVRMFQVIKDSNEKKALALNEFVEEESEKQSKSAKGFSAISKTDSNGDLQNYKSKLKEIAVKAWGSDSFDKRQFNLEMLSFYGKEILPALPVRLGNYTENYVEEVFENIKYLCLSQLSDETYMQTELKSEYLSLLQDDLVEQYDSWLKKIYSVVDTGFYEWQRADENLNAAYNSWQREWLTEYANKNDEWDFNYNAFLQDKQNWINQSYLQAGTSDIQIKNYAAASKMSTAIKMNDSISEYVSSLYDKDKFSRLADFAGTILSFAANDHANLFSFEKIDSSILKDYDTTLEKQKQIESDMTTAAAKYQAELLQKQAEDSLKEFFMQIEERNKGIENWELDMVLKAGYRVDSEIHRNAIVDSTAFKTIREKQTVHRYEYFKTNAPQILFANSDYQGTTEYFILKKAEEIQAKIQEWQEKIFGKTDEFGKTKTKGELQEHIGENPAFVDKIDLKKSKQENLKHAGSGQIGMIIADFQWNSMKNVQGYAELAKPIYEQKLSTSDGWFQLPTIRELFGIVCDVLGNCGAAWIKYLDDVVFGAMDIGMGYKTSGDVFNTLVKTVATSFASSKISAIGAASDISKGSQVLSAAKSALKGFASSVASSYINAIDFANGSIDWEHANSVWTNAANYTSMAGTMLSGALGEINNVDATGTRLNNNLFKCIAQMNQEIGSLSTAAMNYFLTGDISFNIASMNGVGFFEVGFKDGKFSAGISEGGTSFSLANAYAYKDEDGFKMGLGDNIIQTFINGATNAKKVSELKNGDEISRTTLNTANQISYIAGKEGLDLAKDLFNGNKTIYFDDKLGGNGENSLINMSDEKAIGLSGSLATGKKEDQALIDGLIAMNLIQNRPKQVEKEGEEKRTEKMKTVDKLTDISVAYSLVTKILKTDYSDNGDALRLKDYAENFDKDGKVGVASVYAHELAEAAEKEKRKAEEKARKEAEAKAEFEAQNRIVKTEQETMEEARKENARRANAAVAERESCKTEQEVMEIARKDIAKKANEAESNTTNNEGTVELGAVKDVKWGQNFGDYNTKELLGDGLPQEAYNNLAKQNAAERYAEKEYSNPQNTLSKAELKQKALNDNSLFDGKYKPQNYDSSIANVGCTLTTVTYILFCATDILITPAEANEILKNNNIYNDSTGYQDGGNNGINEKNLLNSESYALAINTIAKIKDANIKEDIIQFESSKEETKEMFNKIIAASNSDDIYYAHMRINDGNHSILFKSMEYTNPYDPGNATINVLNPWQDKTGTSSSKRISGSSFKLKEINRADFFKLTAAGKEVYNKVHAS